MSFSTLKNSSKPLFGGLFNHKFLIINKMLRPDPFLLLLLGILLCLSHCWHKEGAGENTWDLRLWYRQPARQWVEALPIGNGRLGAMIFGGAAEERIQFNEDTLWTGLPRSYAHKGAVDHLEKIRGLLFEGRQKEAEELAMREFMSVPLRQERYQPFGDIHLSFEGHDTLSGYTRDLDLDRATASVRYTKSGVRYTREYFASAVDQVIVGRISSAQPGKISTILKLSTPHSQHEVIVVENNTLAIRGKVNDYTRSGESNQAHSIATIPSLRSIS